MQCVKHCNDPLRSVYFDQPVLQTLQMFIGEMLCWIPFYFMKRNRIINNDTVSLLPDITTTKKKPTWKDSIILSIPSTCDLLGTTLMNIGLIYTPVSIYQMTRGSVILIVGLFSVIFLKKRITKLEWISLFIVFSGVFLVGFSGYINDQRNVSVLGDDKQSLDIIVGMILIFSGITMTAVQFVVEEHILTYLDVEPMEVVGYEGTYGTLVTLLGMIIGYLINGRGYFDIIESFNQMFNNKIILYTSFMIMFSISVFNFCGITLTYSLSATSRSTIDTCRTLLVWIISMIIGWESLHLLQLNGFLLLVTGTLAFNGVIEPENWEFIPFWLKELESDVRT